MSFSNLPPSAFLKPATEVYNPNSYTETLYERLQENIETAGTRLGKDEELAAYYHTHSGEVLSVTDFGYHNAHLMIIYGVDQHMNECQVFVHTHSFEVVLKVLKKVSPEQRKGIGFIGEVSMKTQSIDEQGPDAQ